MARLTPQFGYSGLFVLKPPFDRFLNTNVTYTCRSVRSLSSIIADGKDPYTEYYQDVDISTEDYQNDIAENVTIVSLQAGTGDWVHVPDSYIQELPVSNGVKYVSIVIAASLGPIPDETNLENIKRVFKDHVLDNFGVESEVRAVLVGNPVMLTDDEHLQLESARQAKISSNESDTAKAARLQVELDDAIAKLRLLEEYIEEKLT